MLNVDEKVLRGLSGKHIHTSTLLRPRRLLHHAGIGIGIGSRGRDGSRRGRIIGRRSLDGDLFNLLLSGTDLIRQFLNMRLTFQGLGRRTIDRIR